MAGTVLPLDGESRFRERIAAGDEAALGDLYRTNRKPVFSYILRNSGSEEDADDMLQEAVIVVWERVRSGTFEPQAKLGTFLYATVRNLWLRRLQRARRETVEPADDIPADDPSPLSGLMEREEARTIAEALDRLGEPCRRLLLLYYWEERSMEEIATALGFANAATAKARKYQCKKSLEHLLHRTLT